MACILFCVAGTYFNLNCASTVPPKLFSLYISLWLGKYRYFLVVWKYHYYYMNKAFHLMASQDTNTHTQITCIHLYTHAVQ